ncbi:MAG: 2-amino-4-hydroxy-6-hydroxymethyldihydropteridine diphosphokinase [Gammaproteobacteria bacterium]|nr:2-amino-4-hydroxy-6-hydroxymethyldihydropteridine diphosphokinase [Gammaproteobacteria bacterium]
MITAYIGLGSNLGRPVDQLRAASIQIETVPGIERLLMSNLYKSAPMGSKIQPCYINAVAEIVTSLSPLDLLAELMRIETALGRVRSSERWSSRTIDLDVLLYGEKIINSKTLVIPHPGLYERAFVLYPLHEIAPHLVIPGHGPLSQLLTVCDKGDLELLTDVKTIIVA